MPGPPRLAPIRNLGSPEPSVFVSTLRHKDILNGKFPVLKSSSRVAQAFQPVLIVEAGTEARPTKIFHNLRVGRSPMRNCYEKIV